MDFIADEPNAEAELSITGGSGLHSSAKTWKWNLLELTRQMWSLLHLFPSLQ